ncbi:hypothetical protein OC861_003062 [Tilletia horrida]|nr:hypothetical protein OC861_003062 [Tilletia horrida]
MPPVRTPSSSSSSVANNNGGGNSSSNARESTGPNSNPGPPRRMSSFGPIAASPSASSPRPSNPLSGRKSVSSASIPSLSTPPQSTPIPAGLLAPMPEHSTGTAMPVPGEVKPQKACVACRRSKVKCQHDGGPPCRRCLDSGQECKFRLRADDERWRERTDETLTRLTQAVETLITRTPAQLNGNGLSSSGMPGNMGPPPSLSHPQTYPLRQSATFPSTPSGSEFMPGPRPEPHQPNFPGSRSSSFPERGHGFPAASPSASPANMNMSQPLPSSMPPPSSDRSGQFGRGPGQYAFGPLHGTVPTGMPGRDGEDTRMTDVIGTRAFHPTPHGRSVSSASTTSSLAMLPPPFPSAINTNTYTRTPPGTGTGTPHPGHRLVSAASTLPLPPALIPGLHTLSTVAAGMSNATGPSSSAASNGSVPASSSAPYMPSSSMQTTSQPHVSAPPPVPIDLDQTLPSSLLLQVGAEAASLMTASSSGLTGPGSSQFGMSYDGSGSVGLPSPVSAIGLGAEGRIRWQVGPQSPYATPALHLGRDDPRLNAMSLGLITMEKARALFVFFADWLQPHSFGFPTYGASESMTPLIISCILTVSSLLDPTAQTAPYHHAVRDDALNVIKVDQMIEGPEMPLNPELGIGVEEITGAAIASVWLGGEVAWKISRIVRYWGIAYLRHFELPSRNVTLGECLTILPPFRQIDLCDKLRIWLTAYVAEGQQCFLFDRESLASDQKPQAYCQALRAAFTDTEPAFAVPPADRQLIAHASLLSILLEAQHAQRERRWERDAKAQLAAQYAQQQQQHHYAREQYNGQSNGHHHDSGLKRSNSVGTQGSSESVAGSGATATVSGQAPPVPPSPPTIAQEVAQALRNLVALGRDWIEDVERWMVAARKLEDLSGCTAISLDLTLMYHLARAWLGSSALEASRVLNSMSATHGVEARSVAQGLDSSFDVVEHQVIRAARDGALRALQLASSRTEGFAERLAYLPSIYHFLLSHAASFALLLVGRNRRWRYCVSGESAELLRCAEEFVSVYAYAIQAHGVNNEDHPGVRHPSKATSQALLRALQQAKAAI